MSVGRDIEKSRIKPVVNGKDRNGEKWQGSIPGGRGTSIPPSPVTNQQRDEQLISLNLSLTFHCFEMAKKIQSKIL